MDDKRFIELAKLFLRYSFEDIYYNYENLSVSEQGLIDEEEFKLFVKKIQE